jgi:hypothetical protein
MGNKWETNIFFFLVCLFHIYPQIAGDVDSGKPQKQVLNFPAVDEEGTS